MSDMIDCQTTPPRAEDPHAQDDVAGPNRTVRQRWRCFSRIANVSVRCRPCSSHGGGIDPNRCERRPDGVQPFTSKLGRASAPRWRHSFWVGGLGCMRAKSPSATANLRGRRIAGGPIHLSFRHVRTVPDRWSELLNTFRANDCDRRGFWRIAIGPHWVVSRTGGARLAFAGARRKIHSRVTRFREMKCLSET